MLAIFKKELRCYFVTPSGYIFLGLFLLLAGILFAFGTLLSGSSSFPAFLGSIRFVFLFATPVLTMRLMAEETRQRTDQLLYTSPIGLHEVVLGKFFAALALFAAALAVCLCYSIVIILYGDFQGWETASAALGFLLLGACFIAVGTFISTTTENQAVAAVGTFAVLLIFWIIEPIKSGLPQDLALGIIFAAALALLASYSLYAATKSLPAAAIAAAVLAAAIALGALLRPSFFYGLVTSTLDWFSLLKRQESFTMGLIKLDNVIYYLSFIFAFLFLSVRFVEKRRWA
jgi:ABC-2 type transport system permease protein